MQQIIDYLNTNKDKYSKQVLVDALRTAGYKFEDIASAVKAVYGSDIAPEIKNIEEDESTEIHVYTDKKDKIKDFVIGLIMSFAFTIIPLIGWILGIVFLVRYYKKRRYRFYGLLLIYGTALLFLILVILQNIFGIFNYLIF